MNMIKNSNPKVLTFLEVQDLLSKYHIPIAKGDVARSPEEAVTIAEEIGYPVALKVLSPHVSHKTEAKALQLNLHTRSELLTAYDDVVRNTRRHNSQAKIEGILVQEMVQEGTDVIVGISRDPQFGLTLLFGLGGIFVEVLKDFSIRLLPITREDAKEMIEEIKGYIILQGFRGKPRGDIAAIINVLLNLSKFAVDYTDSILELDINPLIVLPEGEGVKAVDLRMVLI
jgi:acyl-CoA synthetase (NDP forming)